MKKTPVIPASLFLLCHLTAVSQHIVTGKVIDGRTKEALPFVNIGIWQKNTGAISQKDGTFSISIPDSLTGNSLTFSLPGYTTLSLPVKQLPDNGHTTIAMSLKERQLASVTVYSKKISARKLGPGSKRSLLHFTDGSTNQNDIFEIAQLIRLDTALSKIISVNLKLTDARKDSGTFRINFYQFDGQRPSARMLEQNIIQTHQLEPGWLKFDLSAENIYLRGDVIVAIEFIPSQHKNSGPIHYEIKPGGRASSFVRSQSQGQWRVPPHQYMVYVTAL
ncbi:carboxypeptidase-like regulatory domain-containing protein [Chitinophaga oryzae]|uniref:Carboxypeptidase-like regulatory domain-containing protein n=1 Tax=Chitinophaga oryzae TaxID=2725414 RepID=A0AAE7D7I7_9BACT|nr:carboxypeptidase-like regulatory domain-containing protein [Chitinophaga oryzae]QJB32835.1 carboxypeptidase-like regulatory domain-containing protein [Chitinophaga oryzae]QJB39288.1 carboxypeptidase-like regulatory domain-containing protein [Chitinophaga oryzae]